MDLIQEGVNCAVCVGELGNSQLVVRYDTREDIRTERLAEELADYKPEALPISVLYPHRRHLSRRVRSFVEWATQIFQEHFWPA